MNAPSHRATLELERFLPYRVGQLAATLNAALAGACARRFGLTLPEWRVLAVLALQDGLSAAEVAKHGGMDKVAVSRALAGLTAERRVERTREEYDRRRSSLRLTPRGRALYREMVPWALAYEQALLRGLTTRSRRKLDELLDELLDRARNVRAERVAPKNVQEE